MNKVVSHILVGIGSAAISGVVTYFVTKKIEEKKFAEALAENTNRLHEYFSKKEAELQTQIDELRGHIVAIVNDETPDDEPPKEVTDDGINRATVKVSDNIFSNSAIGAIESIKELTKRKYSPSIIADGKVIDSEDINEEEHQQNLRVMDSVRNDKYNDDDLIVMNIDDEAYCDPEDERYQPKFDHIEVVWYENDDVMCYKDNNEVINNADELFGEGHMRFKEGVCFIRNVNRRTDYMIIYDCGSYAEEVLGIEPDSYDEEE